ncbi:hypothetical protein TWF788_011217 [Orbilia oligospora]|uniref:Ecp2 effector protein domain-containing protein n=1 Tax=Orbilia oligospora TaxID=2813651 RepID=A0A6G1MC32_ORBOL|nr:hypothetical protein TWF788_011217 [Orbilia oligospora]KAF3213513.1 hypothetical protein TWF679_005329 [Orbilia oligospora]KAF3252966.1 hypothetical protein TWF192_004251 [Orbilia oligospora]
MKYLLLYCLLLGTETLAVTIPAALSKAKDTTASKAGLQGRRHPASRKFNYNRKISPSEINKYLHPEIVIAENTIDCGNTQPIVVDGVIQGCIFTNTDEEILDAIEALTIAKNLTDVPDFENHIIEDPPSDLNSRSLPDSEDVGPSSHMSLAKREPWQYTLTYCHTSGVAGSIDPPITATALSVCRSMDNLAGTHTRSVSWVIVSYGTGQTSTYMFAWGTRNRIRHDYNFVSLKEGDDWVWSSFQGQCFGIIMAIAKQLCRIRAIEVSRGGYVDAYDPSRGAGRRYRIGLDPNPLSGPG